MLRHNAVGKIIYRQRLLNFFFRVLMLRYLVLQDIKY